MLVLKAVDKAKKILELENDIQHRLKPIVVHSEQRVKTVASRDDPVQKLRTTVRQEGDKIKNLLQFEQKIQGIGRATVQEKQPPPVQIPPDVVLNPVQVNGFYKVFNYNTLRFYVTVPFPMLNATQQMPIVNGWKVIGLTGVAGLVILTQVNPNEGSVQIGDEETPVSESYLWSFDCQTDTEQNIQGIHGVIGVTLYPPDSSSLTTNSITGILNGFYYVARND